MSFLDFLYLWLLYGLAFFVPMAVVFGAKTLLDLVAALRRRAGVLREPSGSFDPLADFRRPAEESGGNG